MRLWIDDERPMPKHYDLHAKTAEEAISLLKAGGIKQIAFDHDLGVIIGNDGYAVAKFIEQAAYKGTIQPLAWTVHSGNPVGRKNITDAMNNADRFWARHGMI
jgi:hypothetical protein